MYQIVLNKLLIFYSFKQQNTINNNRFEGNFAENFERLFACRLPHQDTISDVLREVDSDELEEVKMQLAGNFFEQKFLRPYRLLRQILSDSR
ncbi:MAG: hypothetical protein LBG96_09550 [Tannerella sp.]|jgi:hypothetical protein|nr:hypothetical protein [Tannerella sp.]